MGERGRHIDRQTREQPHELRAERGAADSPVSLLTLATKDSLCARCETTTHTHRYITHACTHTHTHRRTHTHTQERSCCYHDSLWQRLLSATQDAAGHKRDAHEYTLCVTLYRVCAVACRFTCRLILATLIGFLALTLTLPCGWRPIKSYFILINSAADKSQKLEIRLLSSSLLLLLLLLSLLAVALSGSVRLCPTLSGRQINYN